MTLRRTVQRAALGAVVLSASALALPPSADATSANPSLARVSSPQSSPARAAALPPACTESLLQTLDKFPVEYFTVPEKAKNTLLDEVAALSAADQEAFTQAACTAWNTWATGHGAAVAKDLDTRYQKTDAPACGKFTNASIKTLKKYAPNVPAATRDLEKVAKKVWRNAMQKLADQATNATCRAAYDGVKAGW